MNKKYWIIAALLLSVVNVSKADFEEGYQAAQRKDYATALKEWQPLAEQGNAVAQYNLGVMYDKGRGVTQDDAQAVEWYRKAANQGYADAQFNLGVMYDNGQGVPQNYARAGFWYKKSAAQGKASAQNNLGVMYNTADGIPEVAYALFSLAAAKGDSVAVRNRDDLLNRMTSNQVVQGQALSQAMQKDFTSAIEGYLKSHAKRTKIASEAKDTTPAPKLTPIPKSSLDQFPPAPPKRKGVTSCNTNCINGDGRRTYDNGRKVRIRAKSVYDPFSGKWNWDAGSC